MLKFSHRTLIAIAGSMWMLIGFFLLSLGLKLILGATQAHQLMLEVKTVLLPGIASYFGGWEAAAVCLIAACLGIGYIKGRFVLVKSVQRVVNRILSMPSPSSLLHLYNKAYYALIGVMIGMGFCMRLFHLPDDVRGAVDVAVGAALINGAMLYFRYAANLKVSDR